MTLVKDYCYCTMLNKVLFNTILTIEVKDGSEIKAAVVVLII